MTSVDDLISSLNGGVHVSQEGYDLQALQKYLADTLAAPPLACSPSGSTAYRPLAPSRSTSVSRYSLSHTANHAAGSAVAPIAPENGYVSRSTSRPGFQRRSSSRAYAFYNPHASNSNICPAVASSPMMEYAAFEGDAFAPLMSTTGACSDAWSGFGVNKQAEAGPSDPWARIRMANQANPFAQPSASGFSSNAAAGQHGNGMGGGFGAAELTGWSNQGGVPAIASHHPQAERPEIRHGPASNEDDTMGEDDEMDAVDQSIGGLGQSSDMAPPALGLHISHVQPNQWTGWGGHAQLGGVPSQWDRGRR